MRNLNNSCSLELPRPHLLFIQCVRNIAYEFVLDSPTTCSFVASTNSQHKFTSFVLNKQHFLNFNDLCSAPRLHTDMGSLSVVSTNSALSLLHKFKCFQTLAILCPISWLLTMLIPVSIDITSSLLSSTTLLSAQCSTKCKTGTIW